MKQTLIGTTDYISLPREGKDLYPAKIDTGADSSAIWASDIEQDDGVLSYAFFAPGSIYYSGTRHKTKRFKVTSVKNSFGHEEVRYKVLVKVLIGNQEITRWFSLADRSNNTYPILLGKNFLENRFVVDVTQSNVHAPKAVKKVFVITKHPQEMKQFLDEVGQFNDEPVEYVATTFDTILFDINGRLTRVLNAADNDTDIAQYALTYVKSHWHYPELAAALAEYLIYYNRPFFDTEIGTYTSRSKLSEAMRLATHDIAIPRTIAGYPKLLGDKIDLIESEIGFPLVFKSSTADRGRDNFFVPNSETFHALLDEADAETVYLAQKYIQNDGFYRINVFGKDATLAVFRGSHPHADPLKQHLNKPSGGVNASEVSVNDLPSSLLELAVRGAMCLDRQIAGVDLLRDNITEQWYILEVNNSPQLRTGAFIEDKEKEFARFIDKELKR